MDTQILETYPMEFSIMVDAKKYTSKDYEFLHGAYGSKLVLLLRNHIPNVMISSMSIVNTGNIGHYLKVLPAQLVLDYISESVSKYPCTKTCRIPIILPQATSGY